MYCRDIATNALEQKVQRTHGRSHSTTGISTSAGALSTAGSFLVLTLSDFQGFAQFGLVASVGIVCALIAALLLMPSFVRVTERKKVENNSSAELEGGPKADTGRPQLAIAACSFRPVLPFAGDSATKIEFEYDLSKLGSKPSKKKALRLKNQLPEEAVGRKSAPALFSPVALLKRGWCIANSSFARPKNPKKTDERSINWSRSQKPTLL